jgi:DNA-binding MarR family transcriptional regulator
MVLCLVSEPSPELAAELFDLERFLPFRLSVLGNRVTRAVARAYAQRFSMTAPEWRALAVLGRFGAMTPQDLVERTAMDKVRVSRAATRLAGRRLVTRRADPVDRRRAILDLTTEGRAVYARIVPLALAVEAELVADLSAAERATLDAALRKIEARAMTTTEPEDGDDDLIV